MSPNLRGGGPVDLGVDPVGVSVCVTFLSAQYLLTGAWIFIKFSSSWIYNWNITKNCLDFSGLDLI